MSGSSPNQNNEKSSRRNAPLWPRCKCSTLRSKSGSGAMTSAIQKVEWREADFWGPIVPGAIALEARLPLAESPEA